MAPAKHHKLRLIPCGPDGRIEAEGVRADKAFLENAEATAALYRNIGYEPPWIGYATIDDLAVVGGGAFVGPPNNGAVEIAYYTLDAFQQRGVATFTARSLVEIAQAADPDVAITAKTLPAENASTRILSGLGFTRRGGVIDNDVGEAWFWRLDSVSG